MTRPYRTPRFWRVVSLAVGLVVGLVVFNFFTGILVKADPITVPINSFSQLNLPPIIRVSPGFAPLNVTYAVFTLGQCVVGGVTYLDCSAYTWWYQWPNSTSHTANIWEPVYVYWSGSFPPVQLIAIYTRFHFAPRFTYGGWALNGTRPVITFSPSPFFIPIVSSGLLVNLLKPRGNVTIISDYTPVLDPSSPYPTGVNAYQPGAGPADPWDALRSPATIQNGILWSAPAAIGVYLFLQWLGFVFGVVVEPKRIRIQKELLRYLVED